MEKPIQVALLGAAAVIGAALIAAFTPEILAFIHSSENKVIWVTGSVQAPAPNAGFVNKFVGGQAKVRYTDADAGQWKTDSLQSCISEGDASKKQNNCFNNSLVHLTPGTHLYNFLVNLPADSDSWWKGRTKVVVMVCAMPNSRLSYFLSTPDMRYLTEDPPCGFHSIRLVGFWEYWLREIRDWFG